MENNYTINLDNLIKLFKVYFMKPGCSVIKEKRFLFIAK